MVQSGRCRQPSKTDRFCIRQHTPKMSHSDWEKHAARYSPDCLFCAFTNTKSAQKCIELLLQDIQKISMLKTAPPTSRYVAGARASFTRVSAKMLNLGMVSKHETNGSFAVMFWDVFHSTVF